MENGESASFEGSADDNGMDSSGGDERNVPAAAEAQGAADTTRAENKKDDFVEEFLLWMENGDSTLFGGSTDNDGMYYSGINEMKAPVIATAEHTADSTEAEIMNHDVLQEFHHELPTVSSSSDPSGFAPCTSLPLIDDCDLAASDGITGREDTPPVEPMVGVDAMEGPPGVSANNHDVAPGAYPVTPSTGSNTRTRQASSFAIGRYGSTIGFVDESKEEEGVPNFVGTTTSAHDSNRTTGESGSHIVEAHPVPDTNEEETMVVAEAHHLTTKWYQRRFYRWILVGSTLFTCGLIVVVIVLVTRPRAAVSSSSLSPPTLAPRKGSPPTPVATSLTPEQIACQFLSIPNVTECRLKVMFDSWNDGNKGDKTTGSTIPSEVGLMTQLTYLDFYNNQLNSTIPSEIGLLSNLTLLSIWKNQLTSTIPIQITLLTNLLYLDFLYNQLTGTIPSEMALMTRMVRWDVSNNRLTSTFPSEMGLLTYLTYLSFYSDQLTGTIPSEIGLLTNLLYIYTSSNQFTSTIPSEMALMTQLEEIDLYNNQLSGSIPSTLCALSPMMIWIDCDEILCGSGCCNSGIDGYPSCG
jgi:hypothetical protein